MGHVIALRREGLKASAPMFIPFMGAVIAAGSPGENALAEARVGLAGPVLGSDRRCRLHPRLARHGERTVARAAAYTGFFLNLFNLLPGAAAGRRAGDGRDGPMDVVRRVRGDDPTRVRVPEPDHPADPGVRRVQTYKRWKLRRSGSAQQHAYYRVRPLDRALVAGVYLSLIALLVVGMHATLLARTIS